MAIGRPAERLIAAWKHWRAETARVIEPPTIGSIERIDHPNIVRVRLARHSTWKPGMLHTAAMSNGERSGRMRRHADPGERTFALVGNRELFKNTELLRQGRG